jgi:hypothetical protein
MILKFFIISFYIIFGVLVSINFFKIIQIRLKYKTLNVIKLLKTTSQEDKMKIKRLYRNVFFITIFFVVIVVATFFINNFFK